MPMGTYNGKLVIGNDMYDVSQINIEQTIETVYIIVDKGLTTFFVLIVFNNLD